MNKKSHVIYKYILLIVLVFVLFILSICVGSAKMSLADTVNTLFLKNGDEVYRDILFSIRFPRAIGAAFIGAALSMSGYMLQTFFKNPIAGPFILGISSGAKLMVALLFVVSAQGAISYFSQVAAALLGAILVVGFVLLCARRIRSMAVLLICGVMVGYICNAITDLVVTFAQDQDIVNLHNWSKGSLAGIGWNAAVFLGISITCVFILSFLITKPMMAYIMGEEYAQSLGVNVKLFRVVLVILSSILAAIVTAFAGPVSFVGVAAPHLTRTLLKRSEPKIMLLGCALIGAVFGLFSDLIARTIVSPTELTLSTVTAVIGAPIVIYLILKAKVR